MSQPESASMIAPADLDDLEPLPVPRKRLVALGVLCLLLTAYVVTPINAPNRVYPPEGELESWFSETIVGLFVYKNRIEAEEMVLAVIFMCGPAVACAAAAIVVFRMAAAPMIHFPPRGNGFLSALLCVPPALWLLVVLFLLFTKGGGPDDSVIVAMLLLSGVPLVFLFIAGSGPARGAVAAISAVCLVGGLLALLLGDGPSRRPAYIYALWYFIAAVAVTAVGVAISCLTVYRAQRKLERAFRQSMAEASRLRERRA